MHNVDVNSLLVLYSCFEQMDEYVDYVVPIGFPTPCLIIYYCRNPSLGLVTKAKGCKVAGQERSPGIMSHSPGNARECEGIDPHTPKGTPTLGVGSPGGLPNFQRAISGVKTQWLEEFFISLKSPWNVNVQNGLASPIWTFKTQVMAKRRARSQIGNLIPDH
jgi:hypothetical protein